MRLEIGSTHYFYLLPLSYTGESESWGNPLIHKPLKVVKLELEHKGKMEYWYALHVQGAMCNSRDSRPQLQQKIHFILTKSKCITDSTYIYCENRFGSLQLAAVWKLTQKQNDEEKEPFPFWLTLEVVVTAPFLRRDFIRNQNPNWLWLLVYAHGDNVLSSVSKWPWGHHTLQTALRLHDTSLNSRHKRKA